MFCSIECTDIAYKHFQVKIGKKTNTMRQKAEDFGGAEVYRHYCDNPKCKKPIILCWKSREGEFCSNKCMKELASPTEVDTVVKSTTEEKMSKKATSKSSSKATVAKPAAAKTTKPKAVQKTATAAPKEAAVRAASKSRPTLNDKAKIHVVSKDHKYKGISADRFKLLVNGMTVDEFFAANKNKLDNKRCGYAYIADFLASATKCGYITVGGEAKA